MQCAIVRYSPPEVSCPAGHCPPSSDATQPATLPPSPLSHDASFPDASVAYSNIIRLAFEMMSAGVTCTSTYTNSVPAGGTGGGGDGGGDGGRPCKLASLHGQSAG